MLTSTFYVKVMKGHTTKELTHHVTFPPEELKHWVVCNKSDFCSLLNWSGPSDSIWLDQEYK